MEYRQVHLDFHTSEKISEIGKKFNKKEFQDALKAGHVASVTLFSKCHHGWAYHPTKANEMHPELDFDILGAQIEAAHEIGVKTPVYLSAGLDEKIAHRHPEWLIRDIDESAGWVKDFAHPGYHDLCFNSPYLDMLIEQIEEVCQNYDADGIFLDIVKVKPCYCQNCVKTLVDEGKDPYDRANAIDLAERVYANYTKRVREAIDKYKPGLPVFHNGGHIRRGRRDLSFMNTHLELESLPTIEYGYDHFPLSAAYSRNLGMEFLGMTGKFHTAWGEFGGFKHPNALMYETALSAALGAKCSIGDQLHPTGKIDMATYNMIGKAYADLEQKEPWLKGAQNIADIAVLTVEAVNNYDESKRLIADTGLQTGKSDAGCTRILLEGKYLFNAVDFESDFTKYKLLILPDEIRLDDKLEAKINDFINAGGKVLATGTSALYEDIDEFALEFGAVCKGTAKYQPDYFMPEFPLDIFERSQFVMYEGGMSIECTNGKVLGTRVNTYFNREWNHFCSHRHTPANLDDTEPAMVMGDDGIYIGWNVFKDYATSGSIILKKMVCYAIDTLLGNNKTIKTNLPAQGIATVTKKDDMHIVHLLYASPVKRGHDISIIEDLLPIHNTTVMVKCDKAVSSVKIVPDGTNLDFEISNGYVSYTVPEFTCHTMIEIK